MARLADDELARLKETVSLQRLAEAKGITLKRHGADLIGLCPFHDDHEPSLVISPDKNLWHCLGACQCGGTEFGSEFGVRVKTIRSIRSSRREKGSEPNGTYLSLNT